jgi:hypothetical protein
LSNLNIEKYPSIIARPYNLACQQDEQWKDLLRFTFENLMTVLASYAASDLLNIYLSAKNPLEEDEASEEGSNDKLIHTLKNIPELKRIGLEQMSLGKWAGALRETTKILGQYTGQAFVPEFSKLFQPAGGNELWKNIDKLISIRNQDAHGSIIPPDKLAEELKKRQEILENILRKCNFLENYSIAVFNRLVIDSDSQQILGNKFSNTGSEEILAPTELAPPLNEVILVDNKMTGFIKLRPLMLYAPPENQENCQLCLYSKRSGDKVHYIGIDGPVDISIEKFDKENDQGIGEPWKYLNEIYSEEDVTTPFLSAKLISPQSIEVEEESNFKILLENSQNSTDLYNIECVMPLPDIFQDITLEESTPSGLQIDRKTNTISTKIDEMTPGDTIEFKFIFIPKEQGAVEISSGVVDYEYFRTQSDRDDDTKTDGEIDLEGTFFEINDPKNPDKMVPVVNLNRRFLNQDGKLVHTIKIGEKFIYELSLTNIGTSAAKSISLQVVFPDHLRLLEGADDLFVDLNPHEQRSFRYLVTTRVPGLYKIYLRDISYKDYGENKYLSSFRDDYSIVVRSDIERQFQYELAEAIEDFTLDDAEKKILEARKDALRVIHAENTDTWFDKALFDAGIEKVRALIAEITKKRGHRIKEEFYNENKKQAKIHGNNPRQALIFSIRGIPFFGVDTTNKKDIIFHSIDAKMIEKIHDFKYNSLFTSTSEHGFILPLSLQYQPMLWSEKLDINFFKKWINLCLTVVEKTYFSYVDVKEKLEGKLGIEIPYSSSSFAKRVSKDGIIYLETGISKLEIAYKNNEIFLCLIGGANQGKLAGELRDELTGLNFLNYAKSPQIDLYSRHDDPESVTNRLIKSNRVTRIPCISISDMSPQGIDNGIENFCKLIDICRLSISRELVETKFAKKFPFDSVKNDIESLYKSGFAFREPVDSGKKAGISMKNSLEVYPFRDFKLGESTTHDCIGFLNSQGNSWNGYFNFYSEDVDLELDQETKNEIEIHPEWPISIPTTNRLFVLNPQDEQAKEEKRVSSFFSLLKSSAKIHRKGSKSIWPKFIGEKMVGEYITFFQDFELLEILAKEDLTIKETIERYDSEGNIKTIKKIIRFNEDCLDKFNFIMPVTIDSKSQSLSLADGYRDWIQNLCEKLGGLQPLMGVNPLVEYLQPLASTCSFLKNMTVDKYSDSLWGYFFLEEEKKTDLTIRIKLFKDRLHVHVGATITFETHQKLISNIDKNLNDKFGSYFSFEPVKERVLQKRPAIQFTFIKEHNDYEIMKNQETMTELHEKLSSFFIVIFEMLVNGLKN